MQNTIEEEEESSGIKNIHTYLRTPLALPVVSGADEPVLLLPPQLSGPSFSFSRELPRRNGCADGGKVNAGRRGMLLRIGAGGAVGEGNLREEPRQH